MDRLKHLEVRRLTPPGISGQARFTGEVRKRLGEVPSLLPRNLREKERALPHRRENDAFGSQTNIAKLAYGMGDRQNRVFDYAQLQLIICHRCESRILQGGFYGYPPQRRSQWIAGAYRTDASAQLAVFP